MEVACENCRGRFRIPDEKLPKGKTSILKCPKCGERITVSPVEHAAPPPPPEEEESFFSFDTDDDTDSGYDIGERPFDFAEEGKTALLCEPDPVIRKNVAQSLYLLDYQITEVQNSRDALKCMRYQSYDLIVVNELFDTRTPDTNGVLIYLERLNMLARRNMFVVMLTNRFRTMDHMIGFQKSVNGVVNLDNLPDLDKIIRHELTQLELFYQVYKDSLLKKI